MIKFFKVQSNISGSPYGQFECDTLACSGCNKSLGVPKGEVVMTLSKAPNKWPDAFGAFGMNGFVVSESLAESFSEISLELGFAQVRLVVANGVGTCKPPSFFLMIPPRGVDLDFAATNLEPNDPCQTCHRQSVKKLPIGYNPSQMFVDERSWNGLPVFQMSNTYDNRTYCSQEFLDLVSKSKWKKFEFYPLGNNLK